MAIVTRPDNHPALKKGLYVRIALVSIARNFVGFKNVSDAWMYMKGFYGNKTLISAHLFERDVELVRYTHNRGEVQMGLLDTVRDSSAHLLAVGAPYAVKQELVDNDETFFITNVHARKSNFTSSREYVFDLRMVMPSLAYRVKKDKKLVDATEPTDALCLTMESSEYRDTVVAALCPLLGISFKKLAKETEQDASAEYGPCHLIKTGRAFDIADASDNDEEEGF